MEGNNKQLLGELAVSSEPGNERAAMEQVASMVKRLHLSAKQLEHLKTAVAEATMNAMEHGNRYQPEVPVHIRIFTTKKDLLVQIEDQGGDTAIPEPHMPDLEAKLAERQSPRGWGLFIIKNLVDDLSVTSDGKHHIVELLLHLEEEHREAL